MDGDPTDPIKLACEAFLSVVGYSGAKSFDEVARINSLREEAVKEMSRFLPPFTPVVGDDSRLRFLAALSTVQKHTPQERSYETMRHFIYWAGHGADEKKFPLVLSAVPEFLGEVRALPQTQTVSL